MTAIIFVLGLAVGSFLNAYIWRLHAMTDSRGLSGQLAADHRLPRIWEGRSMCPKCRKTLRWLELIPLVSFIIQLGRCRGCKARIDIQYPLVELATGILFVLSVWNLSSHGGPASGGEIGIWDLFRISDFGFRILPQWYLLAVLVILFVYDLRFGLVPDRVVLPAILIAFLYGMIRPGQINQLSMIHNSLFMILATTVGAGFFALQYYLSKGRWLGAGDIRIGALMGAMLGFPLIFEGLAVSYFIGGAVGIGLLAAGRKRFGETLPLGTFLTVGAAIAFLYGQELWNWYF